MNGMIDRAFGEFRNINFALTVRHLAGPAFCDSGFLERVALVPGLALTGFNRNRTRLSL